MKRPTLKELWAWWNQCVEHLEVCDDENCELYLAFATFVNKAELEEVK